MISAYLCRGMTGRDKAEVVKEATEDKEFFEKCGIRINCPVAEEKVKAEHKPLKSTVNHLTKYWRRDKELIRASNVVIDMTPHLNSEGVKHELGYGRYSLWKPVVRIYPEGQLPPKASVAFFEDDYITDSRIDALEYILRVHGTQYKRLKWRLDLLNRCLLKWVWYQVLELFR